MTEFAIVSLILLAVMMMDSSGDAFRVHQWQIIHHTMEVLGIATWIALWAFFEFRYEYILMYVTARITFFDPLFNLIAGYKLTYAGKSSVYGRVLSWFMNMMEEPGHLIWVLRAMSLAAWLTWIITKT